MMKHPTSRKNPKSELDILALIQNKEQEMIKEMKTKRQNSETFILFCGEEGSGKSTLIQKFLGKESRHAKPTVGFDYQFARRAKPGCGAFSSFSETSNIWELGGCSCATELMSIPLKKDSCRAVAVIVLDLSKPENVIPSLKKWVDLIHRAMLENGDASVCTGADTTSHCEARNLKNLNADGKVNQHHTKLFILANKYDIFKQQDSAKRKRLALALRYISHSNNASLIFTSSVDREAKENYRRISKQLFFLPVLQKEPILNTSTQSIGSSSDGRKSKKHPKNDKAIFVRAGDDSFKDIMLAVHDNFPASLTSPKELIPVNDWISFCEETFGDHSMVDIQCISTEAKNNGDKYSFVQLDPKAEFAPNHVIDKARADFDLRLHNYRKDRERLNLVQHVPFV